MKLHNRILSIALAALMVCGLAFVGCSSGDNKGLGKPAEMNGKHRKVTNVEPKGEVIMGTSTEANGDWTRGAFSANNATDSTVCTLTDNLDTVTTDEYGDYVLNNTVVADDGYTRTEDANGNVTYQIKIREGLMFNNGDPITAENYVAWTLFVISPAGQEYGAVSAGWKSIAGGLDYKNGDAKTLSGLRLIDTYTYAITINKVDTDGTEILPYYYDLGNAGMRCAHLGYWFGEGWHVKDDGNGCYFVNDSGKDFTVANIKDSLEAARFAKSDRITCGAYNLVSFDDAADQITLEVNPNYPGDFNGQKPGIQKLVIVKAVDETAVDTLKTGGFGLYSQVTDGDQINQIVSMIKSGEIKGEYCKYDRAGYGYFCFQSDFGPTQFTQFRQAIAHLLDRNEFARSFCQGWGQPVHSLYCTALSMYHDSEELFAKEMNTYPYSLDDAVNLLKEAGFVYNEDGTDYVDGSEKLRYKKVTAEEAGTYAFNVTLADGTILMPAFVNWASSKDNSVSDLLMTMLANGDATKKAGVEIKQTAMDFSELLNYLYRDKTQGDQYGIPTYNMFNLATGFSGGQFDYSYEFTLDPELIAQDFNTWKIFDEQLDKLSMDMVLGVDPSDYATYLDTWQKFELRFNELVPLVPLYCNVYISVFPDNIENYQEDSFFGFERAILYARYTGK